MNPIGYFFRKIRLFVYNRKYKTNIHSVYANLEATYDIGVLIASGTIVQNDVKIGEYSYINRNSYVENCTIGKYCSISSGVYICPYEHNYSLITTHPLANRESIEPKRKGVKIGNDVLISLNAIILEGIQIGDGAVIGAGAIVTKDVKPYEIVAGVPAKHIKFRFSQDKIDYLMNLQWWNWGNKIIKRNIKFLRNETNEIFN